MYARVRCELPQMAVTEGSLDGSATSGAMTSMEDTQWQTDER